MKAKPMTGGGGAKPVAKKKMQDLKNAAKTESAKKNSVKKPAVSTTGARVSSRYGPYETVGNPGAGVSRRKYVVSDFIKGAKPAKKK